MPTELETLPGFCDIHLHFREPGDTEKETIETGSMAGASSGVTDGSLMPNITEADGTKIPVDNPEAVKDQHDRIRKTSWMNLGVNGLVWGPSIDKLEAMKNWVIFFKAYMDYSTGGFNIEKAADRREAVARNPKGKRLGIHAEGGTLDEVLGYGEEFGTLLHVLHISSRKELESAYAAKLRRPREVTIGVNPAYLRLTKDQREQFQYPGMMKVKPEIQEAEDQRALWLGVQNGAIDIFETDHAPHRPDEKKTDWEHAAFGLAGLDTVFSLLWTDVVEGRLTRERLVEMYATNPRKIFRIPTSPSSYFQFDPNVRFRVGPPYFSKAGTSYLEGQELQGRVVRTFSGGRCIYDIYDPGKFIGKPDGQVILPSR